MDTLQIIHALRNLPSFLGVFPSDVLPHSISSSGTIIINVDTHTEGGSHWLAITFQKQCHRAFYFDSYALYPFIPSIQTFLRRNCTVWDYNKRRLQGLTSMVCGQYTCLFALYMDRGYTPRQFIDMFTTAAAAVDPDLQVQRLFVSEFGRGPYIKRLV